MQNFSVKKFFTMWTMGESADFSKDKLLTPDQKAKQAIDNVKQLQDGSVDLKSPEAQKVLQDQMQASLEVLDATQAQRQAGRDTLQSVYNDPQTSPETKAMIADSANRLENGMRQVQANAQEGLENVSVVAKGSIEQTIDGMIGNRWFSKKDIQGLRKEYIINPTPELKAKLTALAVADWDGDKSTEGKSGGGFFRRIVQKMFGENALTQAKSDNNIAPEASFAHMIQNHPNIMNNYLAEKNFSLNNIINTTGEVNQVEAEKIREQILKDIENLATLQRIIGGSKAQSIDIVHVLQGKAGAEKYIEALRTAVANGKLENVQDTMDPNKPGVLQKIMNAALQLGVTLAIPGGYVRYQKSDIEQVHNVLWVQKQSMTQKFLDAMTIGKGSSVNGKLRADLLSIRGELNFNDQAEGAKGESIKVINDIIEICGVVEGGEMTNIGTDGKLKPEALQKLIERFSIQEPILSELRNNATKEIVSNLADELAYKAIVDAARKSNWQPKGIEAVGTIIGGPKVSAGMSFQDLGIEYRSTNAKVMDTVLDDVNKIRTERIFVIENQDGTYTYTFKNIEAARQFFAKNNPNDSLGKIIEKDGVVQLISEKAYDIIMSEQYNGNKLTTNFSVSLIPVREIRTEAISAQSMDKQVQASVERVREEDGLSFFSRYVAGYSRTNRTFAQAMKDISAGNYEKAYNDIKDLVPKMINEAEGKTEVARMQRIFDSLQTNGQMDEKKMQALLTYTYGARGVADKKTDITKAEYNESRTNSLQNEVNAVDKWLGQASGLDANTLENEFKDEWTHTPKEASDHAPGQAISVAVVATPINRNMYDAKWNIVPTSEAYQRRPDGSYMKNKDGNLIAKPGFKQGHNFDKHKWEFHRVDVFQASVRVSSKVVELKNELIKDKMISSNEKLISEGLASLNQMLERAGQKPVTKDQYITALKTGNVESLGIQGLKFQEWMEPKFFETRAMVNQNICNNLTYMMALPLFQIEWQEGQVIFVQPKPNVQSSLTSASNAMTVVEKTVATGVEVWTQDVPQKAPEDTPTQQRTNPSLGEEGKIDLTGGSVSGNVGSENIVVNVSDGIIP